jgi:enamine deaminase RidA (YjgF/YER057c/UK114 family)
MHKTYKPDTVAPPTSDFSHGVEVAPGARWLHTAGQIGLGPDGTIADDVEGQVEQAWRNLVNILAAADMGVEDLVRLTTYLTRVEDAAVARAVRARFMDGHEPASTLLVVAALARPEFLFEIEGIAAKA